MRHGIEQLLRELEQFGHANDAEEQDRSKKMLNLERPTAELIHLLLQASKRTSVLEIGTSNGYSTLWLADGVRSIGGRVTSIDRNPWKTGMARENLSRAGLSEFVALLEGDATQVVQDLTGPFDCVFFDADRFSAPGQVEALLPKLAADVLLLADNVLSHPEEIAGYLKAVEALPDFECTTVTVGKGLHIAYRR